MAEKLGDIHIPCSRVSGVIIVHVLFFVVGGIVEHHCYTFNL